MDPRISPREKVIKYFDLGGNETGPSKLGDEADTVRREETSV